MIAEVSPSYSSPGDWVLWIDGERYSSHGTKAGAADQARLLGADKIITHDH